MQNDTSEYFWLHSAPASAGKKSKERRKSRVKIETDSSRNIANLLRDNETHCVMKQMVCVCVCAAFNSLPAYPGQRNVS